MIDDKPTDVDHLRALVHDLDDQIENCFRPTLQLATEKAREVFLSLLGDQDANPSLYAQVRDLLFLLDGRAELSESDRLTWETAEYIAHVINPKFADLAIINPGPSDTDEIHAMLRDGRLRSSWMDPRVMAAMRSLHGEPTGDARLPV